MGSAHYLMAMSIRLIPTLSGAVYIQVKPVYPLRDRKRREENGIRSGRVHKISRRKIKILGARPQNKKGQFEVVG